MRVPSFGFGPLRPIVICPGYFVEKTSVSAIFDLVLSGVLRVFIRVQTRNVCFQIDCPPFVRHARINGQ